MTARLHYVQAINDLDQEIIKMGTLVQEAIGKAVQCLLNQDVSMANQIIEDDKHINSKEDEIEDRCTLLIAKEQPVAGDLRHIITALKIITELERMGDHAAHIAKAVIRLADEVYMKPLIDIPRMAAIGSGMIRDVLTAFIEGDVKKASEVAKRDDEIDSLHEQVSREVFTYMMENPKYIKQSSNLIFISRYLERLGDHATNICERIVYDSTGEHVELNF